MLLQKMCKLFNEKIIWNMNEFGGSQKKEWLHTKNISLATCKITAK